MSRAQKFDTRAINAATDLVHLIEARIGPLKQSGSKRRGLCPFHREKTPSFYVFAENGSSHFHCFGCNAHGDAIGFLRRNDKMSFVDACELLSGRAGLDDPELLEKARRRAEEMARLAEEERKRRALLELDRAREIWDATLGAHNAASNELIHYLEVTRGIPLALLPQGRVPRSIRYHPALPYWHHREGRERSEVIATFGAMVCGIQNPHGDFVGAHITYLDGGRKAEPVDPDTGELLPEKKIRGAAWGNAIRLTPDAAENMGFSEGVENGLSVLCAVPDLAFWVGISLGNLAGSGSGAGKRHPMRPDVRLHSAYPNMSSPGFVPPRACHAGTFFADNDNGDPPSAEALVACALRRWGNLGIQARLAVPDEGKDWNDELRGDQ